MTAELAVLNKSAVALAADSAVTAVGPEGPERIYNSADKLFTLSKYHPVGVMVYGAVEFMGVPWETIIKQYREQAGDTAYDRLEQYADAFIRFLDRKSVYADPESQSAHFRSITHACFKAIQDEVQRAFNQRIDAKGQIEDDREAKHIILSCITAELDRVKSYPLLRHLPKDFVQRLTRRYRAIFHKTRADVFAKHSLTATASRRLAQIVPNAMARKRPIRHTGVVIAGFGEKDVFPSIKSFAAECVVGDRLKYWEEQHIRIDRHGTVAALLPFAQRDVVDTFLSGANAEYVNFQEAVWQNCLGVFAQALLDAVGDKLGGARPAVEAAIGEGIKKWSEEARQELDRYRQRRFAQPVAAELARLPKSELPEVAEALVSLTSLMRRVSGQHETVGGPTDVAIISRNDGFIWVKRKHYFGLDLNPLFTSTYFKKKPK